MHVNIRVIWFPVQYSQIQNKLFENETNILLKVKTHILFCNNRNVIC